MYIVAYLAIKAHFTINAHLSWMRLGIYINMCIYRTYGTQYNVIRYETEM
jgi:hypothetical protein